MNINKITDQRWNEAQEFEYNFWAPQIRANEAKPWRNFEPYFEQHFLKYLKMDYSGKVAMEIGIGASGALWMTNADLKIGIEPLADKLLEINPNLYKGYKMISHGAESIPEVGDETVDCVMTFNVLDHCKDIPAILHEAYRVLVKGGMLLIGCDLKSIPEMLDQGHPLAVSYDWFKEILGEIGFTTLHMMNIPSRNQDLDGCLIYVGEK